MAEEYPLDWPLGVPRTLEPKESPYERRTMDQACDGVLRELRLLKASEVVISSNYGGRRPSRDTGVAVYCRRGMEHLVFPADKWSRIEDNVHAVSRCVAAIRNIDRTGVTQVIDRALSGFRALPPPPPPEDPWWQVLGCAETAPLQVAEAVYRALAKELHPDAGGSPGEFSRLGRAIEQARRARGKAA